ncbi:glucose 1-dehydrogenase [Staphylococcus carnosus]|uniref:Glucose 1-dehydrogenase (NAD(P)(+)) n=1 Tax=Staphylococcus carnosus (strain TM300) TaxID=396513 RepID=B9DKF0_STACT|nr:glucose 1-dehydrogenase [Staphylococcus carnosus]ANZ32459.1 short-chain dehydrogenase [Staphylococcus carnosus]KOR13099.1 short-chain dehydrogenase [Staphylococcus carnosus]QPT05060.1 glucose 1-dehydrogenase [Staphylococcus carnosus]UQA67785.1 glucose 1-dehydrogenase [Staphylococcus carnosus]UTB77394.1 short-chain dehydrogenase [Staphylococcus carnosus]
MNILEQFRLDDKVAIVTGGAMGLGQAMATALAQAGANIVIADIREDVAEATATTIRETEQVKTTALKVDVTNPEDVQKMVDDVVEEYGKIDILINNAGMTINEKAEDMTYEQWNKVINLNLNGVFLVAQAVGRQMIEQGYGSIVNTSSMSGIIANKPQEQCSYNASKAGVIMLTKSLAMEWSKYNIKVNTIAPGYMKTELTKPFFEQGGAMIDDWMGFTPMGRPGLPEELGGIVVYLASDASSFAQGSVFTIDGGYTAL